MSIKMRLLLSYIAMTVIPAILFALIAWGLSSAFFPMGRAPGVENRLSGRGSNGVMN